MNSSSLPQRESLARVPESRESIDSQALSRRAEQKAEEASRAESAGQYAVAVALWAEAVRLAPKRASWQLRQARALQLAGKTEQALAAYDRYLGAAAPDDPELAQAQAWRLEVAPAAATVPAVPTAAAVPAARASGNVATGQSHEGIGQGVAAQVQANSAPLAAWSTFALGAAVLAGGGIVLALAKRDESDLTARFAARNDAGRITGISHTEADADIERIEAKYQLGWGLTGLGAVATAVGAVWLLRSGRAPAVAVVPAPSGLYVALRF